jgi:hypothetical protein
MSFFCGVSISSNVFQYIIIVTDYVKIVSLLFFILLCLISHLVSETENKNISSENKKTSLFLPRMSENGITHSHTWDGL